MKDKIIFEPLDKKYMKEYKSITKLMIFLSISWWTGHCIPGSYFPCRNEEDFNISVAHFKFLTKYKL